MEELRVNPGELASGGNGLVDGASAIPDPLPPLVVEGTDALSRAIQSRTQEIEQPLIDGLPRTKEEALATAQNIIKAAGMYEQTDQQVADQVAKALEARGVGGAGSAGGATGGGAGGADQMGQMMGMPMQMAQQAAQIPMQLASMAAQIPQGIMQGIQSGMQQMSQLSGQIGEIGGTGKGDESRLAEELRERDEKNDERPEEEKAEAGPERGTGERAPDVGASQPAPAPPQTGPVPEAPPAPKPAPTRPAGSDSIVL
ncbi:hypothetical protein JRC04_02305 [Mycolicibacterium sp. S2-37]|uniref:hypothetical protein n=1 Tax=Mycolicibacterium sp. S2-37 TaxID=2810297 RepID=UPI001A93F68D|nr:hypothetical protein [Mycolicibacterium sp. S2-37]MBO0676291.1 hypothetical protein [Mycolicibacterium sp. S2-37]